MYTQKAHNFEQNLGKTVRLIVLQWLNLKGERGVGLHRRYQSEHVD